MKDIISIIILTISITSIYAQTITRVGNSEDVNTEHEQGFLLMGGNSDNMDGLGWFYNLTNVGDVVIIRYDTGTGYNSDYSASIMNSITTIEGINTIEKANNTNVETTIRNAEAVFITGGNQWNYYNIWKDTKLHEALLYLINEKGGSIGGTSAGMAVMSEFIFTAQNNTIYSTEALGNPYHSRMKIADDYLDVPILQSVIVDSHFNRVESDGYDRQGRLFTMVARIFQDWDKNPAYGIGVNEYTAVAINSDGKAYVYGNPSYSDFAYFLKSQGCAPETCIENQPLTWNCSQKALKVYVIQGKKTNPNYLDLTDWTTGDGGYWEYWHSDNGILHKTAATSVLTTSKRIIRLYPNPANSEIWIDMDSHELNRVEIYSTTGQLVLVKDFNKTLNSPLNISISSLTEGSYIVRVVANSIVISERLSIQR